MTSLQFSFERPTGFQTACERDSLLFGSADWLSILEAGFNCRTLFAWDGQGGAAISLFRAGPFSVGYLGFPTGAVVGSGVDRTSIFEGLTNARLPGKPVCLRTVASAFPVLEKLRYTSVANPETAICDLQQWSLKGVSQKARRIRKALREGLRIERAVDEAFGARLYELYAAVIESHGGSARYNEDYFTAAVECSTRSELLDVRIAMRDHDLAGFLVTGRHGGTTYYLHGGTDPRFRALSPSDLLMADAIKEARDRGCDCFNFMASPPDQPTLVRYKEKWGGETRQQNTHTAGMGAMYPLFRVAESLYKRLAWISPAGLRRM
jgi:hypothetical protein